LTFNVIANIDKPGGMKASGDGRGLFRFVDQPTITAAEHEVCVGFNAGGPMLATGAPVTRLGHVGRLFPREVVPASHQRTYGDAASTSQFLPKISLDPTTGDLAVAWYDSRADLGTGGAGDTDGIPNDDAQLWGAFSTNGGASFTPSLQVSAGTSNSHDSGNG